MNDAYEAIATEKWDESCDKFGDAWKEATDTVQEQRSHGEINRAK